MEKTYSSLLYPSEAARLKDLTKTTPIATHEVCTALGLTDLLSLKNASPSTYLTDDIDVILYRESTLRDVRNHPAVEATLSELLPILWDIAELRELGKDLDRDSGASYLYSITEIDIIGVELFKIAEYIIGRQSYFCTVLNKSVRSQRSFFSALSGNGVY